MASNNYRGSSRTGRKKSDGFVCVRCKAHVSSASYGTSHRNHCPNCLWSRHLDESPGDRRCACKGSMAPVAVEVRRDGEWAIVHRCMGCKALRANRIAGDDCEIALLKLALKPLARPAFPIDDGE